MAGGHRTSGVGLGGCLIFDLYSASWPPDMRGDSAIRSPSHELPTAMMD